MSITTSARGMPLLSSFRFPGRYTAVARAAVQTRGWPPSPWP